MEDWKERGRLYGWQVKDSKDPSLKPLLDSIKSIQAMENALTQQPIFLSC